MPELTDAVIDSWKALNCEMLVKNDKFEFWMVPRYTDQDRLELTPEDLLLQRVILDRFPGSDIKMFRKTKSNGAKAKPAEEVIVTDKSIPFLITEEPSKTAEAEPEPAKEKPATNTGDGHPF